MQKVVAVKDGFYDNSYRKIGSVFDIPDGEKLGKWMMPYADGDLLPQPKQAKMGDTKPQAAIDAQRGKSAQVNLHKGATKDADTKPVAAAKAVNDKALKLAGASTEKDDNSDLA